MDETQLPSGSARRFIAFLLAVSIIAGSHWLQLDGSAVTALVTITIGYLSQGALKEVHLAKVAAAAAADASPGDSP